MPPSLTKTDGYGIAPVHGYAITNQLSKITPEITATPLILDLPVDEAKRNRAAEAAKKHAKTKEPLLEPDQWHQLTPRIFAKHFNSTVPSGVTPAPSVPKQPVLYPGVADSLVVHYYPMIFLETRHLPDPEEAASCGLEAMIKILPKYDPSKGNPDDYLKLRVRGGASDWRRRMDMVSQLTRRESRKIEQARIALRQLLGTEPDEQQLIKHLGWTTAYFFKIIDAIAVESVSLEMPAGGDEDGETLHDILKNPDQKDPAEIAARRDAVRHFAAAAAKLDAQQRKVLLLLYGEGLSAKEVAKAIGVSEPRISAVRKTIFKLMGDVLIELRDQAI